MKPTKVISLLVVAACAGALNGGSALAQNPYFEVGTSEIIMGFQLKQGFGSDKTVMVNLGRSTPFRDEFSHRHNLVNIGPLLDQTFGLAAGNAVPWYENPHLFFGAVACWSNVNPPESLFDGDPDQTVYVTKARLAWNDGWNFPNFTLALSTSGSLEAILVCGKDNGA
jgi:hypothetical protein